MSDEPDLFTRLGGTRAIAETLGEAPSTVQSWKGSGRIPAHKQPAFIERYAEIGIAVSAEDVVWPMGRSSSPGKAEDITAAQQSEAA